MILIPIGAQSIIETLEKAGYEGYVVGGCVRDSLLGRNAHDWDITTSATPSEVKELFSHTVDTGIEHGTVTVLMGEKDAYESYEVTTYRIDGKYEDSRHPKEVTFTPSLEEDLKRRDFTINAMAYHPQRGLVDLFGGVEDLNAHIIRCVGNPIERFGEDALRMMRAVRFGAQLGFSIESETLKGIERLSGTLQKISAERIRDELCKLITSGHPGDLRIMYETGLTRVFLPEFDAMMECVQNTPHHCYTVGEHTLKAMEGVRADLILRLTMLLHDVGKPVSKLTKDGRDHFYGHAEAGVPMARDIINRLRFDNDTREKVLRLVRYHDDRPGPNLKSVRRAVHRITVSAFPELFEVKLADTLAQSEYKRDEKLAAIETFRDLYEQVIAAGDCVQIKDLAVDGQDIMALGVPQGKKIGEILAALLDMVVDDPSLNEKQQLMQLAQQYI